MAGSDDPSDRLDAERIADLFREVDWQVGHLQRPVELAETSGTASQFVTMRAGPGSAVFTDEATHYARLPGFGYVHETVNHRRGGYGRGVVSTNWIESVWALLRRGVVGVCHFMSGKHLQRYITEFEARYNATRRHASLADAAAGMFGRTLTYKRLTEPAWPALLVLW